MFRYSFPHREGMRAVLKQVAQYRFQGPSSSERLATSGDISPDGRAIIVRTYTRAMLWERKAGTSVADAFAAGEPCPVPLAQERQGETLAIAPDGRSYFTLGEFAFQPIYRFNQQAVADRSRDSAPENLRRKEPQ